jgi:mono/diheme cytochrome c family protein
MPNPRRTILPHILFFALLSLASSHVVAMPAQAGRNTSPAVLYHNYCSVCHGDKGNGQSRARQSLNPPPKDFTSPAVAQNLSRARMIEVVSNGAAGTAMVGWKTQLSSRQIESVVDYIRTTYMPSGSGAVSVPGTGSRTERGRAIYARTCSVCHGDRGNGSSWAAANMSKPPENFTSPDSRAKLNRTRMITSVTHGRPDTAMPGFGSQLNTMDIEAVVDYVRAAFMQAPAGEGISGTYAHGTPAAASAPPEKHEHHHSGKIDMKAQMPKGLIGDARRGGKFYQQNCATCHGKEGDGRGPRAYFINPKPRNFLHAGSRAELNRPELYEHIGEGVRGTEMPAWDKVLTPQQIADVAEYVFRQFIVSHKQGQR